MTPPVALTIAGSDSGGGAGIQADLKTFAALGVFGTSAITAVTAQDTTGVKAIHVSPVELVDAQIGVILADLRPAAAKTGMLATAEIVSLVADRAERGGLPPLVVDPVMVASTGATLLAPDATGVYLERLFPLAAVVTPNLPEASLLLGREIAGVEDMAEAAVELGRGGAAMVVVKGGHLPGLEAVDVVWDGTTLHRLSAPWIPTANVHGTGCTFSAAVAAGLALGREPLEAVRRAKRYLHGAISGGAAWSLGAGHGPVDHLGWEAGHRVTAGPWG
ncbi:MAG: bifunctional hydroxymethylpyrimidine kinase/phosphomethylpyrimidine kinase [Acidimicrobiales bacterium]